MGISSRLPFSLQTIAIVMLILLVGGISLWLGRHYSLETSSLLFLIAVQLFLVWMLWMLGWLKVLPAMVVLLSLLLIGVSGMIVSITYPDVDMNLRLMTLTINLIVFGLLARYPLPWLERSNPWAGRVLMVIIVFNLVVSVSDWVLPSGMTRGITLLAIGVFEIMLYNLFRAVSGIENHQDALQIGATILLVNLGLLFFSLNWYGV